MKIDLLSPAEIKQYLDRYVIGQDEAKIILSVAVYNHFKKISNNDLLHRSVDMDKSNVLLLGETGSGKTLLAKTIARLLNVPCYIQDCTKITQAGYVGSDVEDCLVGLLRNCNYDIRRAERGIVVLDEIDKVAARNAGPSITRDVSGEGVQQSLLKMVEGDLVGVPPAGGRKHPDQHLLYINTKNILFIASGAFVGLKDIVAKRMNRSAVGFEGGAKRQSDINSLYANVTPQDLRQFGIIPEFVGRFPIITHVNPLTEDDMVRILTEPTNSVISQYTELLAQDKTLVEFEPEALREMAHEAMQAGTGARGLRGVVEKVMTGLMYLAADNRSKRKPVTLKVTREMVTSAALPLAEQIMFHRQLLGIDKKKAS